MAIVALACTSPLRGAGSTSKTSTQADRHHKIKVKIKPDVGSARPSYPEGSMAAATRLAEVLHAQDRAACVRRSAEIKLARTHPCGKRIPLGGSQDQLRASRHQP
jgi:hypothetical protein